MFSVPQIHINFIFPMLKLTQVNYMSSFMSMYVKNPFENKTLIYWSLIDNHMLQTTQDKLFPGS